MTSKMFRRAVLLIAGVAFAGWAGAAEPVKIAFYGSISGVNSESGRQGMLAVKAAQQYVNENGGIKALGGALVEIVPIDGTSDASQGVLPLERDLSRGGISGIVGSAQSAFALISLPILQKYKVPAVTASAANGTITQRGCEFIFQPAAKAAQFSIMQLDFLRYLAKNMGKKFEDLKCAIIFENSAWGEDNAKANRRDLLAAGMTIAVEENYEAGKLADASPIVTKLRSAGVDVVFPSCYANDAKLLMTAMNAMRYKPIVIAGGSAFTWPSLLNDLGPDVNGICSADGWVWDNKATLDFPEFTKIRERYERENNEFIPGQGGPSIISFMLIVEAIENGKSADPVSVRDELRKLNSDNSPWFKAYSIGHNSFDNNGYNADSIPVILQWQNLKPRCVFPPEAASSEIVDPLTLKPFAK
ncbi:MAG: ABC transporter substrate-binding protein [Planctomycetota bacterium]|jgi:branched-chain amino acid transport system substrate-binding protein|nr:ABC transporter substrate-binding protein [Planctomycetota bacterium]